MSQEIEPARDYTREDIETSDGDLLVPVNGTGKEAYVNVSKKKLVHGLNDKGKPICYADLSYKEAGRRCQSTILFENGRCRKHGGLAVKGAAHPNFKDGRKSKTVFLPKMYQAKIEEITEDIIQNLEESIQIQQTLETDLLAKIGSGESSEAWKRLKDAVRDYDKAQNLDPKERGEAKAKAFGTIRLLADEGLSDSFLTRDIQSVHESQRKLAESVSKIRKEKQEVYTKEQWNAMITILLNILRSRITDRRLLTQIQDDIDGQTTSRKPQLIG